MTMAKRPVGGRSVFDDFGFDRAEAAILAVKAELQIGLEQEVKKRGLTQTEAARQLGITRPSLNRLLNGHLDSISIDQLVGMHARFGRTVSVKSTKRRSAA
jgi:predicted XRE-type DNA-binding protein